MTANLAEEVARRIFSHNPYHTVVYENGESQIYRNEVYENISYCTVDLPDNFYKFLEESGCEIDDSSNHETHVKFGGSEFIHNHHPEGDFYRLLTIYNFDARPIQRKYLCERLNSMYGTLVNHSVYADTSVVSDIYRYLISDEPIEPLHKLESEKVEISSEKEGYFTLFTNETSIKVPLNLAKQSRLLASFTSESPELYVKATGRTLRFLLEYLLRLEHYREVSKPYCHPSAMYLLEWEKTFVSNLPTMVTLELVCVSKHLQFVHLQRILSAYLGWELWKPPNTITLSVNEYPYDFWASALCLETSVFNPNLYQDKVVYST